LSFRINHNINALGVQGQLDRVSQKLTSSTSRLSSGLRINKVSDDPGVAITADIIRTRLKALENVNQNAQDAVNMSKAVDAALGEVSRLLSQGRAIAVQAGNSAALSTPQLQALNDEITAIVGSIDRVATGTKWGAKNILDGTAGIDVAVTRATATTGLNFQGKLGNVPLASGLITLQQVVAHARERIDNDITFASPTAPVVGGALSINGVSFSVDPGSDTIQSVVDRLNAAASQTGVQAALSGPVGAQFVRLDSIQPGSRYPINLLDPNGVLNSVPSPAKTITGADSAANIQVPTENGVQVIEFTGGRLPGQNGSFMTDSEGNSIMVGQENGAPALFAGVSIAQVSLGNQTRIQVGTDAGETLGMILGDTRTTKLAANTIVGKTLASVDVTSSGGPQEAMQLFDAAMSEVNSLRGRIGAFQTHTLESRSRSLAVLNETLSSAQSDLIDTDVASEMTEFTKNQVIQQTGIAILGQANQMPQQILRLLE
jgi:flagellin